MKEWLSFLGNIADELFQLFQLSQRDTAPDPEEEKQIAMSLVRKASDARAKKEIEG